MKTFYMVYVEGQASPRHKHVSLKAAQEEAERLVRRGVGKSACVLKATHRVSFEDVKWDELFESEIEDVPKHDCLTGRICEKHPDLPWPHIIKEATGRGRSYIGAISCPSPGMPCPHAGCEKSLLGRTL